MRLRPYVQTAFLSLFLFLLLQTDYRGRDEITYPVNVFLRFDPLVLFSVSLSTLKVPRGMLLALTMVGAALVLGRAFCGWACPLGTLNEWTGRLGKGRGSHWPLKYLLLLALLSMALLGFQAVGFLDPLCLLIRSLSLALEPLWALLTRGFFNGLYEKGVRVLEPLYEFLEAKLLPLKTPFCGQALFLGTLFLGLLALNLFSPRFFCTRLCPLGALLGLLAFASPFRRRTSQACDACGACSVPCPSGLPPGGSPSECLLCGRCKEACPKRAISFGFPLKGDGVGERVSLERRGVILALLGGLLFGGLIRVNARPLRGRALVRPPGALPEEEFLERCVRCGECMKVCLTGVIQPALGEAGPAGLWTPVLDFRRGYCQYACTLCGQVCPTGAIRRLTLEEKVLTRIGLAHIDRDRCLPWAHGIPCIVCEEHCPVPGKAIRIRQGQVETPEGRRRVGLPVLEPSKCIGCGICEFKCPVEDEPAIRVTPFGEARRGWPLPW